MASPPPVPIMSVTDTTFRELVDLDQVRELLEAHHQVSGMAYGLFDPHENDIISVGWQEICVRFHRAHPVTCAACRDSNAFIKEHLYDQSGRPVEYCCTNKMIDIAMPIIIEGKHLATLFIGQFFYEDAPPNRDDFVQQAKAVGFDLEEYLRALDKVPRLSQAHIQGHIRFLHQMVQVLAESGLRTLRLAREMKERQCVEEKLSHLASIVASTDDAVVGATLEGKILSWNRGAEQIYGYSAEEVIGQPIFILLPAEKLNELEALKERLRLGETIQHYETERQRKCGQLIDVAVTISPIKAADGRVIAVSTIARDITLRKREELSNRLRLELLSLANTSGSTHEFVKRAADLFQKSSGCDSVEIRLRRGKNDFGVVRIGYPPETIGEEVRPCMPDCCEWKSRECVGPVGHGCGYHDLFWNSEQFKGHRSENGSFWTDLLSETVQAHRAIGTEEKGNGFAQDYGSIAVIPLGKSGLCLGHIQFKSLKERHFTPQGIEIWECLVKKLSIAIEKFLAEEALNSALSALEERVVERTEALNRANRAMLALKGCDELLARANHESELLEKICQLIAGMDGIQMAWVGLTENDSVKTVRPIASAGCNPDFVERVKNAWAEQPDCCPTSRAIRTREVQLCGDPVSPECAGPLCREEREYAACIGFPLLRENHCMGALTIYLASPEALNEQELDLLSRLASDLAHGIAALRDRTERESLQQELLSISEREKQAIAGELHDGLCQHLAGVSMLASLLQRKLAAGEHLLAEDAKQIVDLLNSATQEARNLSHGLHPVGAEPESLMSALSGLARMISNLFHVPCTFHCPRSVFIQDQTTATHLFRVAQEACNNALKHGIATEIRITLEREEGAILLQIQDDGCGMPEGQPASRGMGLRIMNYRAQAMGATVSLQSEKNRGTIVRCVLPEPSL